MPMLILGFARPTLFERRADWLGTQHSTKAHRSQPAGQGSESPARRRTAAEACRRYLRRLSELIIGRSEGNPFYMEELIKMLVDQGAIEIGSTSWSLHPERLLATHVPPTLTGVLQARLDGLPAPGKAGAAGGQCHRCRVLGPSR